VVGICGTLPLLYAQTSSMPGSHHKLSLEEGALTEANHITFSLGKREEVRYMQQNHHLYHLKNRASDLYSEHSKVNSTGPTRTRETVKIEGWL